MLNLCLSSAKLWLAFLHGKWIVYTSGSFDDLTLNRFSFSAACFDSNAPKHMQKKKKWKKKTRTSDCITIWGLGVGGWGGVSHMKCIQLLCDLKENELTNKLFDCK